MQVVFGPHVRNHVTGTSVVLKEANGMYMDMERLLLHALSSCNKAFLYNQVHTGTRLVRDQESRVGRMGWGGPFP